ncbi:MAG: autotransporter outer membrane beta-barrel domain-containing protein, partial [Selenomonas sp.]|nr:autotransporter outer membrane beta-barrel domain-containing protein [Selenomonas sp.]
MTYTPYDALPEGKYAYSVIRIGKYVGASRNNVENGWWIDADTVLPTNEQAADFVGTFRHELGHALGIICVGDREPKPGKPNENNFFIDKKITDKLSWTLHLRDQNDTPAKAGMYFVDSNEPKDPNKEYFVVDKTIKDDGKGYAYFYGDHVTEALGGATFFGRSALPVNGWELSGNILIFDGSHLQTAGMMSHRKYSNYTTFLEVELAVMQDLGYQIDRKAFYGRSVYGNGGTIVNNQGYFARNADGTDYLANTYSLVPLGVGLHIYGSDNKVTQNADIMTAGVGAVGVRVDGTGNTLIVPENTEIHADGRRGNGLLIAYGRNHTIEQAGTVTASGEGGTGVRFDFGSSSNGARDEYRGSYIRFKRELNEQGAISGAENLALKEMTANLYNANKEELDGPLVKEYNLSGTLIGADNAIYIAKNAFVKNININKGASIKGDITSDWKQFGEDECEGAYDDPGTSHSAGLRIQYNKKYGNDGYEYDEYIPDLVTNLNFNTDMAYSGNIIGEDNMKMNVKAGTLTYEGTANVVNVQVEKGAALLGGKYTVNAIDATKVAAGFTATTTGQLINHGTIGASAADRNMEINGKLVSDGKLQAYGGGDGGQIKVSDTANVDKSTVTAYGMLPGETKTVLTAKSIDGDITNADEAIAVSGMLNAQGKISSDHKTITVETTAANNLDTTDAAVSKTYDAVMDMYNGLGEEKSQQGELRKLLSFESEKAASALTDISSPNAAQGISMTQTSTVTSHILSTRLAEAFAMNNVDISVPVSNLADDKESTVNEGLKLQAKVDQPVENNIWFKTAKNWGELKGGANYHGTTFALGYDKAAGKNWRVGGFVSYGSSS